MSNKIRNTIMEKFFYGHSYIISSTVKIFISIKYIIYYIFLNLLEKLKA